MPLQRHIGHPSEVHMRYMRWHTPPKKVLGQFWTPVLRPLFWRFLAKHCQLTLAYQPVRLVLFWTILLTCSVPLYKVGTYEQLKCRHWTKAESYYIMTVWNSLAFLLVSIMLLSQDWVTIIRITKFRIRNIAFIIKGSFEGHSNWNMN